MPNSAIKILYFSDVLCVWAYVAQIRLNELEANFGDKIIIIPHHFCLFGNTQERMANSWKERGGYEGFNQHILEVCRDFPYLEINAKVWKTCRPTSSGIAHLFLKAIQLYEFSQLCDSSKLACGNKESNQYKLLRQVEWAVRLAFFRDARDISKIEILYDIANEFKVKKHQIEPFLNDGSAMAIFCSESAMKETYKLDGSPTYLLNENRQKLFGNIGYKILEANISELLCGGEDNKASWC